MWHTLAGALSAKRLVGLIASGLLLVAVLLQPGESLNSKLCVLLLSNPDSNPPPLSNLPPVY